MDKREDDFNDENKNDNDNDNDNELNELPEIPETLRGEQTDEIEKNIDETDEIEAKADNAEILEKSENGEIKDETENISVTDPEFKNALSEFTEESDVDKAKDQDQAEILTPVKPEKSGLIKRIVIVSVIAVVLIGGGLFAFWFLQKNSSSYIMSVDGEKISTEELKLTMILNIMFQTNTGTTKETAIDQLKSIMILDKAAKDKKIEIPQDEKDYMKETAGYIKEDLKKYNQMPNVTDERLEIILDGIISNTIYTKLTEQVVLEKNFTVDEVAYAAEFATYNQTDKLLKYLMVSTVEEAENVRNIIAAGGQSTDDIIKQYSLWYDESYGIEKVNLSNLSQIGLSEEQNQQILALNESEASEAIDFTTSYGTYGVFVTVTDAEAEETFRQQYIDYQKYMLFEADYSAWETAANIKMNDKAVADFDENAFLEKFWADVNSAAAAEEEAINTEAATEATT